MDSPLDDESILRMIEHYRTDWLKPDRDSVLRGHPSALIVLLADYATALEAQLAAAPAIDLDGVAEWLKEQRQAAAPEQPTCSVCAGFFTPEEWDNRHSDDDGEDCHERCCPQCNEPEPITEWGQSPIMQEALKAAGWNQLPGGVEPDVWTFRREQIAMSVWFAVPMYVHIATDSGAIQANGVRTMSDLRRLRELLTGKPLPGEGE